MSAKFPTWFVTAVLPALLVGVAFYFSVKLGLVLSFPPDYIAVFWPPNAIILAALLLTPPRKWWVFFLAMAPAYFIAALQGGYSEYRVAIFFSANCSEILVAAITVRYFLGRTPRFASFLEAVVFTVFAAGVAPFVSACVASLESLGKPDVAYVQAWRVWFLGDSLAHLTITPLLLVWITGGTSWVRTLSYRRCLEMAVLGIGLAAVGFYVFGGTIGASGNLPVLVYLPLPLLLWAAVRFGPRGACSGIFLIAVLSIWHAVHGRGPFTAMTPAENVLALQMFLAAVSVPLLFLAGLVEERRQAEGEREKLIDKLEAQNAELERFTYTVSHDLKSPLITIVGYVGMLRQDLAAGDLEQVEDDLSRIANAAGKMDQLLRDVLELSRIGRSVNPLEDVPLEEVTREAMELTAGQVKWNGVQVEISSDLPIVHGDRLRLQEVMQNLIDNAAKYMDDQPEPRIEIGSRRDDDQIVCYVRDNGIGIEHCYHERVFGLFDQLNQKVEGSGIGLALVKRIIEGHGGRIWVESEGSGNGSTFCFTLAAGSESSVSRRTRPC